jgi:hypothetical protein
MKPSDYHKVSLSKVLHFTWGVTLPQG